MKICIILLVIIGLSRSQISDKTLLSKQKFLFEIVYRIEEPLMFEEYIKLGKTFTFNKADYTVSFYCHTN